MLPTYLEGSIEADLLMKRSQEKEGLAPTMFGEVYLPSGVKVFPVIIPTQDDEQTSSIAKKDPEVTSDGAKKQPSEVIYNKDLVKRLDNINFYQKATSMQTGEEEGMKRGSSCKPRASGPLANYVMEYYPECYFWANHSNIKGASMTELKNSLKEWCSDLNLTLRPEMFRVMFQILTGDRDNRTWTQNCNPDIPQQSAINSEDGGVESVEDELIKNEQVQSVNCEAERENTAPRPQGLKEDETVSTGDGEPAHMVDRSPKKDSMYNHDDKAVPISFCFPNFNKLEPKHVSVKFFEDPLLANSEENINKVTNINNYISRRLRECGIGSGSNSTEEKQISTFDLNHLLDDNESTFWFRPNLKTDNSLRETTKHPASIKSLLHTIGHHFPAKEHHLSFPRKSWKGSASSDTLASLTPIRVIKYKQKFLLKCFSIPHAIKLLPMKTHLSSGGLKSRLLAQEFLYETRKIEKRKISLLGEQISSVRKTSKEQIMFDV